ncbi:MAG: SIMPL domain-containing protein [Candidatus Pacebacteria bacterium]|nr:SIMPL domain-containing protein [Candidatus Paceibacterota bacterium]MDD3919186.1 SIMPL domain-containing protein [Candidatus Paceibacterota bacterium]
MDDINFNNQVGPDPINAFPKKEQNQLPVKPVFKKENNLHPLTKITLVFAIIFFVVISFYIVNLFLTDNNKEVANEVEKTISVSSSATVYEFSEFAVVNISTETSGVLLSEVVPQNFKKTLTVSSAIEQEGVSDITSVEYSVSPKYQKSGDNIVIASYTVKEVIKVKMPIEKVDSILEIALNAGANSISDLIFEVKDFDKLILNAKSTAITSAEKGAKVVAEKLNLELGELIGYSDNLIDENNNFATVSVNLIYSVK